MRKDTWDQTRSFGKKGRDRQWMWEQDGGKDWGGIYRVGGLYHPKVSYNLGIHTCLESNIHRRSLKITNTWIASLGLSPLNAIQFDLRMEQTSQTMENISSKPVRYHTPECQMFLAVFDCFYLKSVEMYNATMRDASPQSHTFCWRNEIFCNTSRCTGDTLPPACQTLAFNIETVSNWWLGKLPHVLHTIQ